MAEAEETLEEEAQTEEAIEQAEADGGEAPAQEQTEAESEGAGEQQPETVPLSAHVRTKNRLKRRNDELATQNEALKEELAALKRPTLEEHEFDEGKYAEALDSYEQQREERIVQRTVQGLTAHQQQRDIEQRAREAEEREVDAFLERTKPLGLEYAQNQDAFMDYFGDGVTRDLIRKVPNAEYAITAYAKDAQKAGALKALLETDVLAAVTQFTLEAARLSANPETKQPPPPDTPPEGSSPGTQGHWEKQLEKARKKAGETGDFSHVTKVKEAMRAAQQ